MNLFIFDIFQIRKLAYETLIAFRNYFQITIVWRHKQTNNIWLLLCTNFSIGLRFSLILEAILEAFNKICILC